MKTTRPLEHPANEKTFTRLAFTRSLIACVLIAGLSACGGSSSDSPADAPDSSDPVDDGGSQDENDGVDPVGDEPPANALLLQAYDPTNGKELWISDGTEGGNTLVKDINGAGGDSEPGPFIAVGDTTFFAATTDAHGRELWKTDGTAAGTELVKDINPGGENSLPTEMAVFDGMLYFSAFDTINGRELWRSDGTEAGTLPVKDINPGIDGSVPQELKAFNGELYFMANDGGNEINANNAELWKTDGTGDGTVLVKDINPFGVSDPRDMTVLNSKLYFRTRNVQGGIWTTDGTEAGTALVKELNSVSSLTLFNNMIYFAADDGDTGIELWRTDGSTDGTVLVRDIHPDGNSVPSQLQVLNNTLFFVARTADTGRELWKSDGSQAGTELVKDIHSGATGDGNADPQHLTVVGDTLYFAAEQDANDATGAINNGVWKTDGSEGGTVLVEDSFLALEMIAFNNALYLSGGSPYELWKSNDTGDGLDKLSDFNTNAPGVPPKHLFVTP
jgi:ELWxxDGT repeat protein